MAHREEGRIAESVHLLSMARDKFPDAIAAMYELSISLRLAGQCDESLALNRAALKIDPDHRPSLLACIETNLQHGRTEAALQAAQDALEKRPEDTQFLIKKGAALRRTGRSEQSVRHLDALRARAPENLALLVELAISLRDAGDEDASLAVCEQALALHPTHRNALRARIDTLLHFHRLKGALAAIDNAGDTFARDIGLQLRRGRLLQQIGRFDESSRSLAALLERLEPDDPQRDRVELERARALLGEGDCAASLALTTRILNKQPRNLAAWLHRIDTQAHVLQLDDALTSADDALAALPANDALLLKKATLLRQAGWLVESDRLLRSIASDTPQLQLARIESALALGRIDTARSALQALWDRGDQTARIALDLIRTLRMEGDLTQARIFAETAVGVLPDAPTPLTTLLDLCLEMNDRETADRLLEEMPPGMRDKPALRQLLAKIALRDEDFEGAATSHIEAAGDASVPTIEFNAALAVARSAITERDTVQSIFGRLEGLLDRKAASLPPFTISMLRARMLAAAGDWKKLHPLVTSLEKEQPRLLELTLLRARAAFELARFDEAGAAVARVLENNPLDAPAARLRNALLLLQGKIEQYFEINIARAANPAAMTETDYVELVKNLLMAGRNDRAADLLKYPPRHFRNSERIGFQRQLMTGDSTFAEPDRERVTQEPDIATIPGKTLARLLDFNDETALAGDVLIPSLWIAWMMRSDAKESFDDWRRVALAADHVYEAIRQKPRFGAPPREVLHDTDYAELGERMRNRLPTLIVTSHSGPAMLSLMLERFETIRYFVQPFQKDWIHSIKANTIRFAGHKNDTAVEIVRNLRQGNSIYSLPDLPVSIVKMHDPSTMAVGTLFGQPYPILDTFPKISRAMRIPSFWVQPVWREGKIHIDIERLPMAEPGEAEDVWCARWAQSYLDRVEALLASGPENQSLRLPVWRYFLLKGLGPAAIRHAEESMKRLDPADRNPARWIDHIKNWASGVGILNRR
ncbi:tetratricopeptide repeat protein [Breoghania corrubedonensis]|uniref:tetratricopeptide repeat protein n=1 Tax=Breoghania corrubedonensis TaxID=665038 RepID=UPI0014745D7D|nr:tetratricopeptide repeat protein [Breoghania corrubedonensis]